MEWKRVLFIARAVRALVVFCGALSSFPRKGKGAVLVLASVFGDGGQCE